MKLLLIAPSSGRWKKASKARFFSGKTFRFSLLSLLTVAAECPSSDEVKIVDEQIEKIPWDESFDLVGITCMTALAPRAYEISAKFRMRKIPVVLGGMHPTLCPEEAIKHADAVVVGDVEGVWQTLLADLKKNRLRLFYHNTLALKLNGLKPVPRSLLNKGSYATINAVQATRGCPNSCTFCSVSSFHKRSHRQRPVDEVIEEISKLSAKFFILVDDNLTADQNYAKRLFEALIPLKKFWVSQASLAVTDNPSLVEAAAESGCIGLFVGIETFSDENLCGVSKDFNRVEQYQAAIKMLHAHGIAVEAGIVFGFENDGPTVFKKTLDLLDDLEIDLIQPSILTPVPGTECFSNIKNRIFDRNWNHYDFHSAVFHPRLMSAQDLQNGHDWVTCQFYKPWRILKRFRRHVLRPHGFVTLPYLAAVSFAYYGRVLNWNIRGINPAITKPTDYLNNEKTGIISPISVHG